MGLNMKEKRIRTETGKENKKMIVQNSLIAIFDRVLALSAAFQKNFIMRLPW